MGILIFNILLYRSMKKLDQSFYTGEDVVNIAKGLLGKYLYTNIDGRLTAGMITETEAYCGKTDKACHAYPNKMTNRTKVMFETGGIAYIYLCYGIHHLLNIVTNTKGNADAVLIRAIEPKEGIDTMLERRKYLEVNTKLTSGPGSLSQALGITTKFNSTNLSGEKIWLTEGEKISNAEIFETTRIGVNYAGEDALLPWRFYIKGNPWVSRK